VHLDDCDRRVIEDIPTKFRSSRSNKRKSDTEKVPNPNNRSPSSLISSHRNFDTHSASRPCRCISNRSFPLASSSEPSTPAPSPTPPPLASPHIAAQICSEARRFAVQWQGMRLFALIHVTSTASLDSIRMQPPNQTAQPQSAQISSSLGGKGLASRGVLQFSFLPVVHHVGT